MGKTILTKRQINIIRRDCKKMCGSDIARNIGVDKGVVGRYIKKNKLGPSKKKIYAWRAKKMYKPFTPAEDAFIRKNLPKSSIKKIATQIKRTSAYVSVRAKQLGLGKIIKKNAIESRIRPGNVPQNKGLRQKDYMSKEAIERTKATRFKKGEPNHNSLFDGAITLRHNHKERGEKPHKFIRISKGIWKGLQIYNWEKKNGPVPKGFVLACQNGDTLDCRPSNWKLLSKADNARRNAGHVRLPDNYVASLIAGRKNKDLKEDIKKVPELLNLKRKQILLNRTIKNKLNEQNK